MTDLWIERHQQIYPGETLCGLLVPWVHGDLPAGRDLLWFVDNEAVVSSLIKGSSGVWVSEGAPPPAAKSFSPVHARHSLGAPVHDGDFDDLGVIRF